jgi:hypothetical protein
MMRKNKGLISQSKYQIPNPFHFPATNSSFPRGFQSIGAYHAPVGRGVSVANALMKGRT